MIIDGTITEDISQYKVLYLNNTEDDFVILQQFDNNKPNKARQYTVEFLNFIPEEFISNETPVIFKWNGLNNSRSIIIILELSTIKDIQQVDFYSGNTYKFSVVLENLDRRYSQIIQISYGEDKTPNLNYHLQNKTPHSELLTVGLMDKLDNINIPSTLYSDSITTFSSSGFIGNTLVTTNFNKIYMGEIDEQ
jgi:hypothetical protein